MKSRSPNPGSRPASPAPLRKAASSPSYCFAPGSLSELVHSTQSSPLPRGQETAPSSSWYGSTMTGSDSMLTLPYRDYCVPLWEPKSCSCSSLTEPPHECSTHTDELLESPSDDPTPEHSEHADKDDMEAGGPKFDFRFLQDINWRNPSVLMSLAVLVAFFLALVSIMAITRSVTGSKMDKLEVIPEFLEKEEANPAETEDVTSTSTEKQVAKTTMRWIRRSKAKRAQKEAKRTRAVRTPKPRVAADERTVSFPSRRRLTKAVVRSTKLPWGPRNRSRPSRKPQSTRAAAKIKRRAAKTTSLHGLRSSKTKTHKAAKRKLATTAPKPRMRAHGRTVSSTSRRRRTKAVSRTTKRTWAPPNSSRRSRQPQRKRVAATTKRPDGAKRRKTVHPRQRTRASWNAPSEWSTRTPPRNLVGGEMARATTTLALQRPMITTGKGLSSVGSRFVGATRTHSEAVTENLPVGSSIDADEEDAAAAMTEDYARPPRLKEPEDSSTAQAEELVEEVV